MIIYIIGDFLLKGLLSAIGACMWYRWYRPYDIVWRNVYGDGLVGWWFILVFTEVVLLVSAIYWVAILMVNHLSPAW